MIHAPYPTASHFQRTPHGLIIRWFSVMLLLLSMWSLSGKTARMTSGFFILAINGSILRMNGKNCMFFKRFVRFSHIGTPTRHRLLHSVTNECKKGWTFFYRYAIRARYHAAKTSVEFFVFQAVHFAPPPSPYRFPILTPPYIVFPSCVVRTAIP